MWDPKNSDNENCRTGEKLSHEFSKQGEITEPKNEMSEDCEDSRLPRTLVPSQDKRSRRVGDVTDSMGEFSTSPASFGSLLHDLYSSLASVANTIAPKSSMGSADFVTPQQPISPDQGYSSPEFKINIEPDHYSKIHVYDASKMQTSENKCTFSIREILGKMSTHKEADRYNMEHQNRGKCVIFNHENFTLNGCKPRKGTRADAERIEKTFQRLGFIVEICKDYNHNEVINKIVELSGEDHSDNDCICIFVLTHGQGNNVIGAKNVFYNIDDIWKPFTAEKCSSLAGKPKLFFFQACRGNNFDSGVKLRVVATDETDSSVTSYKIPTHADFLFAYSTVEGFSSWRNPEKGTWYVRSLCDILDEYADSTDLVKMLTMTARKVATDFITDNSTAAVKGHKQVPSVTSILIRDLYFTSKIE